MLQVLLQLEQGQRARQELAAHDEYIKFTCFGNLFLIPLSVLDVRGVPGADREFFTLYWARTFVKQQGNSKL